MELAFKIITTLSFVVIVLSLRGIVKNYSRALSFKDDVITTLKRQLEQTEFFMPSSAVSVIAEMQKENMMLQNHIAIMRQENTRLHAENFMLKKLSDKDET